MLNMIENKIVIKYHYKEHYIGFDKFALKCVHNKA